MRVFRTVIAAAIGVAATGLLAAGPASAAIPGASANLGPVALPSVPAQVCTAGQCVSTPPAQSISLSIEATPVNPNVTGTPPTITQVPCPGGTQGLAARVNSGSAAAAVSGTVTVTVNGAPVSVPVAPAVATPERAVTVYGCTGVS